MTVVEVKRYSYKPRAFKMFICGLFFLIAGVLLADAAYTNDRGLIINGIIHLNVSQANIFYTCLACVSLPFVLMGAWGTIKGLTSDNYIELSGSELKVPQSHLFGKGLWTPLIGIKKITKRIIRDQEYITILCDSGKTSVMDSFFVNKNEFNDFVVTLGQRWSLVRPKEPSLPVK